MAFPDFEMDYSKGIPPQVDQLIRSLKMEMSWDELQEEMGLSDRKNFRKNYLNPVLDSDVIEYTIPEKLNSSHPK